MAKYHITPDGPAVETVDRDEYWVKGEQLSEEEFNLTYKSDSLPYFRNDD